jgi:iron-sulfur cluster repair protein YtfE (RIC family)
MPSTRKKPAAQPAAKTPRTGLDAIALLRADHRRVADLYAQYEGARSVAKKKALVASICDELSLHAQVEEEIFYPAVKAALKDKELVPEATVEHASLKELIAQVKDKEPDGEMFDARIQVMAEYTRHHVKEEQTEMFPKAQKTRLDMKALGARIAARKQELLAHPELRERPPEPASEPVASASA